VPIASDAIRARHARPGPAPECVPSNRQRVQCSHASLNRMLMHEETLWFLVVGAVPVFMGIAATTLRRLPCSAAMFYLATGYALGPPVSRCAASSIARAGEFRLARQSVRSILKTSTRLRQIRAKRMRI